VKKIFSLLKKQSPRDKEVLSFERKIFGFSPASTDLYKTALRHRSATRKGKEEKESYERLEFLGDAVLDTVVAHLLYNEFPQKGEGFLTKMKSKIVGRSNLNALAVKLGVHKMVESYLGKKDVSESVNGDAFEALLGAVYLDKGYTFTQKAIHKIIERNIDVYLLEATDTDYKSKLIEWGQKQRKKIHFQSESASNRKFETFYEARAFIDGELAGFGEGVSKKRAEQMAAEEACKKVEKKTE
jgi:ribonuclease III